MGKNRINSRRGQILFVTTAALFFLTVMAVTVARRLRLETALVEMSEGYARSRAAAYAGVAVFRTRMRSQKNNLKRKNANAASLLSEVRVLLERRITFPSTKISIEIWPSCRGPLDPDARNFLPAVAEDSRINLNTLPVENASVLEELLVQLGWDEEQAREGAALLMDWRDSDDRVFGHPARRETEFWSATKGLSTMKNAAWGSRSEVVSVLGLTEDEVRRFRDWITVIPAEGRFVVNLDFAPEPVLRALARSRSGPATRTTRSDADRLVEKWISTRKRLWDSDGGFPPIEVKELGLTSPERAIVYSLSSIRLRESRFWRFCSVGRVEGFRRAVAFEGVLDSRTGAMVALSSGGFRKGKGL